MTRAGLNGSSTALTFVAFQAARPLHVRLVDDEVVDVAQAALQQHLDRERQLVEVADARSVSLLRR